MNPRPEMPLPVGSRVVCLVGRHRGRRGTVDAWFDPHRSDMSRNAGSDEGPVGGMCWVWYGDRHRPTSDVFAGLPARWCYRPGEITLLGEDD